MRAVLYERYGAIDELHLAEAEPPELPPGGAVVLVKSAALNPKDALFRRGRFRLLSGDRFPKRTGVDFAGVVRVAAASIGVRPAERVFGALDEWRYRRGTLAEQVAVNAEEMAVLPEALDFDTGAALALTGMTALQALRDIADLGQGARVAIHGASGGVGTLAVQIARVLGADVVTTSSERNFELCRRLGACETLDYASSPFERRQAEFDCLFDVFGNLRFERVARALRHNGTYVTTVPSFPAFARDLLARAFGGQRRLIVVRPRRKDLETLAVWTVERRIEPVIDSRFSFEDFAQGFGVIESKRARGKVVIRVAGHPGGAPS